MELRSGDTNYLLPVSVTYRQHVRTGFSTSGTAATESTLPLTGIEADVLRLAVTGHTTSDIAEKLRTTGPVVRTHLRALAIKLDAGESRHRGDSGRSRQRARFRIRNQGRRR